MVGRRTTTTAIITITATTITAATITTTATTTATTTTATTTTATTRPRAGACVRSCHMGCHTALLCASTSTSIGNSISIGAVASITTRTRSTSK